MLFVFTLCNCFNRVTSLTSHHLCGIVKCFDNFFTQIMSVGLLYKIPNNRGKTAGLRIINWG